MGGAAGRAAAVDERAERGEQLCGPGLHFGDRAPQPLGVLLPGLALHRGVRPLHGGGRDVALCGGKPGSPVARMADAAAGRGLPEGPGLLSAGGERRGGKPGPAHCRGRAHLYDDDAVFCADDPERGDHGGGVFRGAVVDQPPAVHCRGGLCGGGLHAHSVAGAPAGGAERPPAGQGGQPALGTDARA